MNESRGDYRSISPDGSRWKSMARLTNNLINRPNLINFVRQFCAPFQLMIRVHATWHVSSSPLLPPPLPCTLSSDSPILARAPFRAFGPTSRAQFLPNENWLSGIRGTSPSFDATHRVAKLFPSILPVRIFDFFFFFDFDTGNRAKIESNFYQSLVDEIVNTQLYNWGQFFFSKDHFLLLFM